MHTATSKIVISLRLFFLVATLFFIGSCSETKKHYEYSLFSFGTLIDITLYDVDKQLAQRAFEQLESDFKQYHQDWSPWTNGALAQINLQIEQQQTASVDNHLAQLIEQSIELSQQSNTLFNPTIGKLINLWQFHRYQEADIKPPTAKKITTLLKQNPQMHNLQLSKNKLSSSNPAVALNFGAFAKGYAIHLSIKRLQQLGINNAVINAGGDLSVIGKHGDRAWNIGIKHPRKDKVIASVSVQDDESVFTSGDYERFYDFNDKRYHHILDPRTGYPTDDTQSVTVIHHDAGRADAAATALFVAGRNEWQTIAKKMQIKQVMLIDGDGNIHLTPAMQKRIKFLNKSPTSHIILSQEL